MNKNLLAQPKKDRHFCLVTRRKTHNSLVYQKNGSFSAAIAGDAMQFEAAGSPYGITIFFSLRKSDDDSLI